MSHEKAPLTVPCPICKKTVSWDDKFPERPFCSARCKLIDLGDWATESHKIAGDPVVDDLMSDDIESMARQLQDMDEKNRH